jgi:hypothetical protein
LSGGVRLPALVWIGSEVLLVTLPDDLDAAISAFAKFIRRSFPADLPCARQEGCAGQVSGEVPPSVLDSLPHGSERDGGEEVVALRRLPDPAPEPGRPAGRPDSERLQE